MTALELVLEQAEDKGLWFLAVSASGAYLQHELRRLHAVVEAEAKASTSIAEVVVYLREIDAGTDNACWAVCAKGDPGATSFIPT